MSIPDQPSGKRLEGRKRAQKLFIERTLEEAGILKTEFATANLEQIFQALGRQLQSTTMDVLSVVLGRRKEELDEAYAERQQRIENHKKSVAKTFSRVELAEGISPFRVPEAKRAELREQMNIWGASSRIEHRTFYVFFERALREQFLDWETMQPLLLPMYADHPPAEKRAWEHYDKAVHRGLEHGWLVHDDEGITAEEDRALRERAQRGEIEFDATTLPSDLEEAVTAIEQSLQGREREGAAFVDDVMRLMVLRRLSKRLPIDEASVRAASEGPIALSPYEGSPVVELTDTERDYWFANRYGRELHFQLREGFCVEVWHDKRRNGERAP